MQVMLSFQKHLQHLCFVIFHFQLAVHTSPCGGCRIPPQTYWSGHSRDFYSEPLAFCMHVNSFLSGLRSFSHYIEEKNIMKIILSCLSTILRIRFLRLLLIQRGIFFKITKELIASLFLCLKFLILLQRFIVLNVKNFVVVF